jgi:hypothetical protein
MAVRNQEALMSKNNAMASRLLRSVLVWTTVLCLSAPVLAEDEEPDPVILGIALSDAPMTLQKGLAASEAHGKPISAKFEVADKDVQLSVYTATDTDFFETTVNAKTGAVISAEPITDADDLLHAKAQKAAMEKVTVSLQTAAEKATKENPEAKVVSIIPELQGGQAVATVKLLRQRGFTTVTERLN